MPNAVTVTQADAIIEKHGGRKEVLINWAWVYFNGQDAQLRAKRTHKEIEQLGYRMDTVTDPWREDQKEEFDYAFRYHL